jgi:hypothetical protein
VELSHSTLSIFTTQVQMQEMQMSTPNRKKVEDTDMQETDSL